MIPKFSIRHLLWVMVAIGLLSLCMSSAARGNHVAFGVSIAVFAAVFPLMAYAIIHWASFSIASLWSLLHGQTSKTMIDQPEVAAEAGSDFNGQVESRHEAGADDGTGGEHA